jgi:hypothetical protein
VALAGIGLMLIFAVAPFQHDLSVGGPVKFSLAEINLWLAFPVLLLRQRWISLGPLTVPVYAYLLIGGVSSLLNYTGGMSEDAKYGLVSYIQTFQYWVVGVGLFCRMPRRSEEYRPAWIGLVCVGMFLALALIATRNNYVLGLHKNGIGASMACAFIVAVELWFAAQTRKQRMLAAFAVLVIAAGLTSLFRAVPGSALSLG